METSTLRVTDSSAAIERKRDNKSEKISYVEGREKEGGSAILATEEASIYNHIYLEQTVLEDRVKEEDEN